MKKQEKLIIECHRVITVGNKNLKTTEKKLAKYKAENNLKAIANFEYGIRIITKSIEEAEKKLKELTK